MTGLLIRHHATPLPYLPVWQAMQTFTAQRTATTTDELWLLEHNSVFTQGLAGRKEHVLDPKNIPVIQTDRGGQVTYHGPGQLMIYPLCALSRLNLTTHDLVTRLEQSVIETLLTLDIPASRRSGAPGVYVKDNKIGSIGLRVRRQGSYHGFALNVSMDLTPFQYINPCGFSGLHMTQIQAFHPAITLSDVTAIFIPYFCRNFGYTCPKTDPQFQNLMIETPHA